MSIAIVNDFKIVYIKENEGQRCLVTQSSLHLFIETIIPSSTVSEPGQYVFATRTAKNTYEAHRDRAQHHRRTDRRHPRRYGVGDARTNRQHDGVCDADTTKVEKCDERSKVECGEHRYPDIENREVNVSPWLNRVNKTDEGIGEKDINVKTPRG